MSAGHHTGSHPVLKEREHEIEALLDDRKFAAAVSAYQNEDDSRDIPFLGGSNNRGDTVYFDRRFTEAVKAGQVKYDGKPYDPRPFVKLHEAVEGVLIRLYGKDYQTAHDFATDAERIAVEHAGLEWTKYQSSLEPFIHADEREKVTDPPPDLLTEAYKGTKQDKEVEPKGQAMPRYAPNPAGDNASNQIRQDETQHPRQHALAMASATHLLKMGHIDQGQHTAIHQKAGSALAKMKKMGPQPMAPAPMQGPPGMDQQQPMPFGSFAPR